jgi:Glycosyltransferase like family
MDMPKKIRVVSASREGKADFLARTALGRSLSLYQSQLPMVELRLFEKNARGLPAVYNEAIAESMDDPAILLFVHDDIHLCDFYWVERIFFTLQRFDIIGLAGNKRRVPNQPGWAFVDTNLTWDALENLSGVVGHGKGFPPTILSVYGAPFQEVKLLDGLLLACSSNTLRTSGLKFDDQFDFDFYDMDFCRQAEIKNLRMGTCGLSVVHESAGSFHRGNWSAAYERYLRKWGS